MTKLSWGNRTWPQGTLMETRYRNDIDGLRAISVLSVILNHLDIRLFSGGFIGVDVFFVISGYLITGILIREIQAHEFSLVTFYNRRIRRILPALFGMIAPTVVICGLIYEPEKFRDFARSVMATTLFGSNINFWRESGYFDAPSQLKPLLHTWSLAVEEQFYIFFPLFMILLMRYTKKHVPLMLGLAAILSFSACLVVMQRDPSAAFYLAPLRAWELLTGALLATNLPSAKADNKHGGVLSWFGIVLVVLPVFLFDENTSFPGYAALIPVAGAALVLYGGNNRNTPAYRLLSLPPLVFTGKISYSLYLWHWPLIIFWRHYTNRPLTEIEIALQLILIFFIATASWRYIETPFRSINFLQTRQVYALAVCSMAVAFTTGAIIYSHKGFPERDDTWAYTQADKKNWNFEKCNMNYLDNSFVVTPCRIGAGTQQPTFLIWGDSHAPTSGKAVDIAAKKAGTGGALTYMPGCPTLLDILAAPSVGDVPCLDYNHAVLKYLDEHPELHKVIIINRWTPWAEGTRYKDEAGGDLSLADTLHELPGDAPISLVFTLGLERTIKRLVDDGREVYLITPIPEIGHDVPSANFIATQTGRDVNEIIAPTIEEYLTRNQETNRILHSLQEKYGIHLVEPWKILCVEGQCRVAINGLPLYQDDDHISPFGSEIIAPVFDVIFE